MPQEYAQDGFGNISYITPMTRTVYELTEEDRPGETKPGEDSHWHIFHIIDRRMV